MNNRIILGRPVFISIVLNAILLGIVLGIFHPCFNNDPDIFYSYKLAGGFGNAPTDLLHYSYGWHPFLGKPLAALFSSSPGYNWYTLFLLGIHYFSCVVLLNALMRYLRKTFALICFLLFFLFIESRLLIGFNYSGAALIATIGGSVGLLLFMLNRKEGQGIFSPRFFVYVALILVAGMIRIHYFAIFSVFALWMAIFLLPRKRILHFFLVQLSVAALLMGLYEGQKYYYRSKIDGWNKEESLRKAFASLSNHPRKAMPAEATPKEMAQEAMVDLFFVPDSTVVNAEAVTAIAEKTIHRVNPISSSRDSFYWLLMDLKIYLLMLALVFIVLGVYGNRERFLGFIFISLFPFAVFIGICLFLKLTEVLMLCCVAAVFIPAIFGLRGVVIRKQLLLAVSLVLLFCCWRMSLRLMKADEQNRKAIDYARSVIGELNQHPEILFVDAGQFFDLHLSIWDLPVKYPIRNFVYNELFVSNMYREVIHRKGIGDLVKAIPHSTNIYLVGEKSAAFIDYYKLFYNLNSRAELVPGFRFIPAYRIIATE